MNELVALPGVGRKTANVVLGTVFHTAVGVVVDTHVGRISRRLGLSCHSDAVGIEKDLVLLLPKNRWIGWSHCLIEHGRNASKQPTEQAGTLSQRRKYDRGTSEQAGT